MENLNSYNELKFKEEFIRTDLYRKVTEGADDVFWHKMYDECLPWHELSVPTPRYVWYHRLVSVTPFYYLKFLTDANPKYIHDLGCGMNFFKKFIPNVIGIGAEPVGSKYYFADEYGEFNDEYVANHQNHFESLFSINSIHFAPITKLREIVEQFISMVKPGGRGFLTMNVARMLACHSSDELESMFGLSYPRPDQMDRYVREELADLPCKILCFDVDMSYMNEYMLGNIRIVFERE